MAKKDATQSGVLEQETETGVQASPNPRNDFLEQLATQNHEAVQAELAEAGLAVIPEQTAADATPAPAATNNAPHILSEEELATMQVKTKVDGIEELRPVGDVLKSYQKDSAASRRMEEAARRQAELDAREQDLRQREEALLSGNTNNSSQANPSSLDDQAGELVTALYEGDEAKTKEAVKKLLGERQQATPQQTIDPAALANEVERQLATKQAFKAFGENYQEIVADPYLAQVADSYLAKELQDGVELNVALTNAGNATREWLQAKQPTVSNNDRQQRKAQIDNIPAASQKSGSPEPVISGEGDARDVIREMRKARGLSV